MLQFEYGLKGSDFSSMYKRCMCCSVLQCIAGYCRVLQGVAACSSVLQRVAVCCSVLQCVTACCNMLQFNDGWVSFFTVQFSVVSLLASFVSKQVSFVSK